jgi:hypothetical protein
MLFSKEELVRRRREKIQAERALAIQAFGGKCSNPTCGSTVQLEFAHLRGTDLRGMSRGSYERVADVIRHPDHYMLFCHECHLEYDEKEREGKELKQLLTVVNQ